MKKNGGKWLALGLVICLFLGIMAGPGLIRSDAESQSNEFRGVWVATVYGLNYPGKTSTDPEVLKQDAIKLLDNVKEQGFNAVILQVRPSSDAFYPSQIFPWSKYLTGTEGTAPADGFDPLAFFVKEAHKRGLQLHAWINPYRITAKSEDNGMLSSSNPAVLHPDWTVTHNADGKMYWNPGIPEVRKMIVDGVKEIVRNYDVDGVQIDDYFYPDSSFEDSAAYQKYGAGASLADWRRANNDQLVQAIHDAVHSFGKNTKFGVSPFGIWKNQKNDPLGSATSGKEGDSEMYADARGWVKKGWVDYIAPQIYWNIGYQKADYGVLSDWWSDVVRGTDVKLYIGMAAYRADDKNPSSPWYGMDEIRRQVQRNRQNPEIAGSIMYSYAIFAQNPNMKALMKELNGESVTGSPNLPPGQSQPQPPQSQQPPQTTLPQQPSQPPQGNPNEPSNSSNPGDNPQAVPVFSDLAGHWAKQNMEEMAKKGIILGDDQGCALPDNSIKRADYVLMLMRMLSIQTIPGAENFSDVPGDSYYASQLATARQLGLVGGIGNNHFEPENLVTRQDMMVMTYRALKQAGKLSETTADSSVLSGFSDGQAVADYAREAMSYFVAQNVIQGSDDGKLHPEKTATRGEAATILTELINQLEGASGQ